MRRVVGLRTTADLSAEQRVSAFIRNARQNLDSLVSAKQWSADSWDVSTEFVRRGKPRARSRLYFFQHGSLIGRAAKATGTPLHPEFYDFAKAYIRYTHSAAPMTFERLQARLYALGHIEAAFRELGMEPRIHLLSPEVLTRAVQIGTESVSPMVGYQRGILIEKVFEHCTRLDLLATSFQWRHGIAKPQEPGERIGVEFERRRAEKLPSRQAFEVLAHVYCQPRNLRDEILSAVSLICICSPWRASEVLQLRTDCEVSEMRREAGGELASYGLRAFPGKNNKPQIKWIPDITVDRVTEAIQRLRTRCDEARSIAAWYVRNPHQMYLPADLLEFRDLAWLTSDQLAALAGQTNGVQWAKKLGLEPRVGSERRYEYRFGDVEKAVLAQLPMDFPHQNGLPTHPYAETLILVREGALRSEGGTGSRVMFEAVDINQFNRWLSGSPDHQAVFSQYGFTEQDGSPISVTTHAFRHWNNNIAHMTGVSQEDLALWSGRDPAQNKYYDHQTAAEMRTDLLKIAMEAGGVGPLFEAADSLPEPELITREEFLRDQIGSSHATEVGACFHDYALQPCQNHGDCLTCEENGFIKGEQGHRAEIARMLGMTEMQLTDAQSAMSAGDYGADLWVHEHERKVKRMRLMLAMHDDSSIPDGIVVTLPADRQDSEIEQALRLRGERANLEEGY